MNDEKPDAINKTARDLFKQALNRQALPWLLVAILAVVLVYYNHLLAGERYRRAALEQSVAAIRSDIKTIKAANEQNALAGRIDSLETATWQALQKNREEISRNYTVLTGSQRLFDMKSFIDDLTAAQVRIYYHEGKRIDTVGQYKAFIREQIVNFTRGADSAFIRTNRYYYYDLMAAFIIYGSKETQYKKSWNKPRLHAKNGVFRHILDVFQQELPSKERMTMLASLEEIHRNASGKDLPLVSVN